MSDVVGVEASAAIAAAVPTSAGALLRAAREAQGLHIGALAVALKVPVKKIEALESDRFQELPDMVFVRSIAMSICRTLKINPEQVLALLPDVSDKRLKPMDGGLNTRFRDVSLAAQSTWRSQLSSPIGLAAIVLLVATLVVLFWRSPAGSEAVAPTPAPVVTSANSTAVLPVVVPEPTVSAAVSVGTETAATAGPVVAAIADVAAVSAVPGGPLVLEIKARGVSWVEVNDADGVARVRKLTAAGEVLQVSGKLPLSVVLGRADQLDVVMRGQPFDVSGVARDNVARFEVK